MDRASPPVRDVLIVGGGPVGCALALALADSGLRTVVLDARGVGGAPRGDRSLALSHGARLILERLGAWSGLPAAAGELTAIRAVDVSQRGGFGGVRLDAEEQGVPALGYVVSYLALQRALDAAMRGRGVPVRFGARVTRVATTPAYATVHLDGEPDPEIARLVVVADGGGSALPATRRVRHDYRHCALVAFVGMRSPHAGVAYERFTPDGPVALLPAGDEFALVWTAPPARAQSLLALDPAAFLGALQAHFGDRLQGFTTVRERRAFPLVLQFATALVQERTVLIGNAAQTLHPVAGQGFNVGLRDAFELAQALIDGGDDPGACELLARYARSRRLDRYAGIGFTHALSGAFSSQSALLRWPRGLALALLDALPPAKRAFTRAMLYGVH